MKRLLILSLLFTLCTTAFGQIELSDWRVNLNFQDERLFDIPAYKYFGDAYGRSHFNGWAVGIERKIFSKKNLDFSMGINYSKIVHLNTSHDISFPIFQCRIKPLPPDRTKRYHQI